MGVTCHSIHAPPWIRPCYLVTLVFGCRSVDVASDRTCTKILLLHFARPSCVWGIYFLLMDYRLKWVILEHPIKLEKSPTLLPRKSEPVAKAVTDLSTRALFGLCVASVAEPTEHSCKERLHQASVAQRLESNVQRLNYYPVNKCCQNHLSHPVDSELSSV